jgi:hypothetical protein
MFLVFFCLLVSTMFSLLLRWVGCKGIDGIGVEALRLCDGTIAREQHRLGFRRLMVWIVLLLQNDRLLGQIGGMYERWRF